MLRSSSCPMLESFPPLTDQAHWPKVNVGFKLQPRILRKNRREDKNTKEIMRGRKMAPSKCSICQGTGHRWRTCKRGQPDVDDEPKKKRYKNILFFRLSLWICNDEVCLYFFSTTFYCVAHRRRNKKTSSVAVSNQLEGGTSNVAESNQLQVVESNVDASNTLEGAWCVKSPICVECLHFILLQNWSMEGMWQN